MLRPIVVAPMAGGPSTPALVNAATAAGATGFLAAGYKTPQQVSEELRAVHGSYGLNIFVPGPPPPSAQALQEYRALLQTEADRYGVELPPLRLADDDHFSAKVSLAIRYAVPFVSFTFGVPSPGVVAALQAAGSRVLVTVTSASEAVAALAVSPDALIVQGGSAGGHSATVTPAGYSGEASTIDVTTAVKRHISTVASAGSQVPAAAAGSEVPVPAASSQVPAPAVGSRVLPAAGATAIGTAAAGAATAGGTPAAGAATIGAAAGATVVGATATESTPAAGATSSAADVAARANVVIIAAGGVADKSDVERLLAAGATAVQCGTAFLLADEAGTRPAQREFMLSGHATETVVTRAFTGQPARALRNRFTDTYTAAAPIGYPAVHHLTAPLRAAAAQAADPDGLNLWAGTGFRSASPGPLAELVARLTP